MCSGGNKNKTKNTEMTGLFCGVSSCFNIINIKHYCYGYDIFEFDINALHKLTVLEQNNKCKLVRRVIIDTRKWYKMYWTIRKYIKNVTCIYNFNSFSTLKPSRYNSRNNYCSVYCNITEEHFFFFFEH